MTRKFSTETQRKPGYWQKNEAGGRVAMVRDQRGHLSAWSLPDPNLSLSGSIRYLCCFTIKSSFSLVLFPMVTSHQTTLRQPVIQLWLLGMPERQLLYKRKKQWHSNDYWGHLDILTQKAPKIPWKSSWSIFYASLSKKQCARANGEKELSKISAPILTQVANVVTFPGGFHSQLWSERQWGPSRWR